MKKNEKGDVTSITEVTAEATAEKKFCMECGKPLTPIMIYYCEQGCKQRYLVDFDEETGRPILSVLGREESETELKEKSPSPPIESKTS